MGSFRALAVGFVQRKQGEINPALDGEEEVVVDKDHGEGLKSKHALPMPAYLSTILDK